MKKFIHAPKKVINCVKGDFNFTFDLPYIFEKLDTIHLAMDANGTLAIYKVRPMDVDKNYWFTNGDYEIVGKLEDDTIIHKSNIIKIQLGDIEDNDYELTDYKC